jgi:hypothetical protein
MKSNWMIALTMLLIAAVYFWMFRYEYQSEVGSGVGVTVVDRWTGHVQYCAGGQACIPSLSSTATELIYRRKIGVQ